MAKTGNGAVIEGATLDIDTEELRGSLGVSDLEDRVAYMEEMYETLAASFGEWLVYVNILDRRQQNLEGQSTVSEDLSFNERGDGEIEIIRQRPALPFNILNNSPVRQPRRKTQKRS